MEKSEMKQKLQSVPSLSMYILSTKSAHAHALWSGPVAHSGSVILKCRAEHAVRPCVAIWHGGMASKMGAKSAFVRMATGWLRQSIFAVTLSKLCMYILFLPFVRSLRSGASKFLQKPLKACRLFSADCTEKCPVSMNALRLSSILYCQSYRYREKMSRNGCYHHNQKQTLAD